MTAFGVSKEEAGDLLYHFRVGCVSDIRNDIAERVLGERTRGLQTALRGIRNAPGTRQQSIAEHLEQHADNLRFHGWGGNEIESIRSMLKPGERLVNIAVMTLETSAGRTLDRATVRAFLRPSSHVRDDTWEDSFGATLSQLKDLEQELAKRREG